VYRVYFFCRRNPGAGWQGSGKPIADLRSATLRAMVIQAGTGGKAIVQDANGNTVYSIG
jgi:hypothetical protein